MIEPFRDIFIINISQISAMEKENIEQNKYDNIISPLWQL
jgi:hypothetical protein